MLKALIGCNDISALWGQCCRFVLTFRSNFSDSSSHALIMDIFLWSYRLVVSCQPTPPTTSQHFWRPDELMNPPKLQKTLRDCGFKICCWFGLQLPQRINADSFCWERLHLSFFSPSCLFHRSPSLSIFLQDVPNKRGSCGGRGPDWLALSEVCGEGGAAGPLLRHRSVKLKHKQIPHIFQLPM